MKGGVELRELSGLKPVSFSINMSALRWFANVEHHKDDADYCFYGDNNHWN